MIFRVGTYKGAVEQFMTDKLSDANREQITAYQRTIWGNITRSIAKSRKITADDVNRFADEGGALLEARKAVAYKLVDELKYRREVEQYLMDRAGQKGDKLKATSVAALKGAKKKEKEYRNKIAVVYAEGEIVESLPGGFSAGEAAITERLNDDLKKLEDDDDVKAVVLRVNSPGGSAYVSEQIWKAVSDLKKKKPVILGGEEQDRSSSRWAASQLRGAITSPPAPVRSWQSRTPSPAPSASSVFSPMPRASIRRWP